MAGLVSKRKERASRQSTLVPPLRPHLQEELCLSKGMNSPQAEYMFSRLGRLTFHLTGPQLAHHLPGSLWRFSFAAV